MGKDTIDDNKLIIEDNIVSQKATRSNKPVGEAVSTDEQIEQLYKDLLAEIAKYRPNKNLDMVEVSNYVSMNYSVFSLDFKEYTGKNFVNYLKDIRLQEAKRLLDETDMKIIEIGEAIGYENDKHFLKVFKGAYSVTPSEYRKNIKNGRMIVTLW